MLSTAAPRSCRSGSAMHDWFTPEHSIGLRQLDASDVVRRGAPSRSPATTAALAKPHPTPSVHAGVAVLTVRTPAATRATLDISDARRDSSVAFGRRTRSTRSVVDHTLGCACRRAVWTRSLCALVLLVSMACCAARDPAYSVSSCAELGWSIGDGDVCGGEVAALSGHHVRASWTATFEACASVGARLCTLDELLSAGIRGASDGELTWSATPCGDGAHFARQPHGSDGASCVANGELHHARCCADAACSADATGRLLTTRCTDSDDNATDSYGDSCASRYDDSPSNCGGYDDADFSSPEMCCACGGGSWAAVPSAPPTASPLPTASALPSLSPTSAVAVDTFEGLVSTVASGPFDILLTSGFTFAHYIYIASGTTVTISGNVILDGGGSTCFFFVQGELILRGLTLSNGNWPSVRVTVSQPAPAASG